MGHPVAGDGGEDERRLHPAQAAEDKIRDLLMRTVREEGLDAYIHWLDETERPAEMAP